jgi:hypothetical protein
VIDSWSVNTSLEEAFWMNRSIATLGISGWK